MLERCAQRPNLGQEEEVSDEKDEGPRPLTVFGPGIPAAEELDGATIVGLFTMVSHEDGEEWPGELGEGGFLS